MMNELYEVISVNKPTYVFVRSYCQLKAYFYKKTKKTTVTQKTYIRFGCDKTYIKWSLYVHVAVKYMLFYMYMK